MRSRRTLRSRRTITSIVWWTLVWVATLAVPANAADVPRTRSVERAVDAVIPALMSRNRIPGMAVAVTIDGRMFDFSFGVASTKTRAPVTRATLFEIGSVTKTFTATLAAWAQVRHHVALRDDTARYLPALRGAPFGTVTLASLGTHTPGGLPLQFPDGTMTQAQLMRYLRGWRPAYPPDTRRTYSNQGIGVLGFIAAKSMHGDFRTLAERRLFPALGLRETFIAIPASERAAYAWGISAENRPIRARPGTLSDETYGIKTTAADLIRFVAENIDPSGLAPSLREAVTQTHVGYVRAGPMTQDLVWEQYPYPVSLASLLRGNAPRMFFDAVPVERIVPPQAPQRDVWLDKTGSTNGFGAYVACVPSRRIGVVLLANRNYPISERVTAAYRIVRALASRRLSD